MFTVGDGSGKPLDIQFGSASAQLGVLLDPDLKFGEAYMDGTLVMEEGSITELLTMVFSQNRSGRLERSEPVSLADLPLIHNAGTKAVSLATPVSDQSRQNPSAFLALRSTNPEPSQSHLRS